MRLRRPIVAALVVTCAFPTVARAQQRGSDVGGQVSRRKLTKLPKLVHFVEAAYPAAQKGTRATASVVLTIAIDAAGNVADVKVTEPAAPDFDAAAIAAARGFVFEPAEVDDKPAPSKITYRYDFVLAPEEPATPVPARLEGDVRDSAGSSQPNLTIVAGEHATTTDAAGYFVLDLPPGHRTVLVGAVAFTEDLVAGKRTISHYQIPARATDAADVSIRGGRRVRRETTDYVIRAEQGKKIAGTQGDVLKAIQNLPGVSRPPLASGQIVVWGSGANDTRVYIDGVDLPALYHGSGLRGTVSSDLVSTIDLVPGAFGAEYGRGIGGIVRVETKPIPRGTHGYAGVDTLDGSALVSTELTDTIRTSGSFRYGWLDRALALTAARDVGDYFPIPRYLDAQLKTTFDLRKNESIDTVLLLSADDLDRTIPSADPAKRRVEQTSSNFWRAYARYTSVSDRGNTTTITPFFGQDSSSLSQQFGATPARLDVDSTRYGLRSSLRSPIHRAVNLVIGLDALGTASKNHREGSLTLPPREGDIYVFGQPPGDDYAVDTWKTNIVNIGPHVYADIQLGPVLVTPGFRYDGYLIEGTKMLPPTGAIPPIGFSSFESGVDPRLSARWDVNPRFALTAAYGTYHQAPQPEELSAVFGTPALALEKATHITFGQAVRITGTTSLEATAFDKRMSDLVVRTRLTNPIRARALTQNGEGHSYGMQLFLRQELWKGFFGFASYAITKSERRYEGEAWRAFDFDQPHVLSVVASQELGAWSVGARFRYASGNPRTPVLGSTYDSRNDRFDPVFGAQNTIRLPSFWQLDLRVDRSFALGHDFRLLAFADLQNIANHQNGEEFFYSSDYGKRDTIKGLPFIAVAGVRIER